MPWLIKLKFLLNPRVLLGVAVAGLLTFTHMKVWNLAVDSAALEFQKYQNKVAAEVEEANEKIRLREETLLSQIFDLQKEKEREIQIINSNHDALVRSLRERPSRNSAPPAENSSTDPTNSSGGVCTGRELSREDAEFLAREAARADTLREALIILRQQYERARESVNGNSPE